jgi:hypothetical protein
MLLRTDDFSFGTDKWVRKYQVRDFGFIVIELLLCHKVFGKRIEKQKNQKEFKLGEIFHFFCVYGI